MADTKKYRASSVSIPSKKIADVPDKPTIGTATDVGTSRAYNNGSATVTYTAAATGGTATTFTATSTPGSFTATGASPLTITGLQSATSYTFAVSAANSSGTLTSASTSAITATTVPQAPTIGTFTDGGTGTSGTLSFTAGATGGSTITNYKYSTDSSTYTALSPSQTTSPLSLTGLSVGTYNFSVKAVNANGDSSASGTVSGTVVTPSSFESIATVTGTGSSNTITFSSIPQTYKSLQVRALVKSTYNANNGAAIDSVRYYFNGDTGNTFGFHYISGTNGGAYAGGAANNRANFGYAIPNSDSTEPTANKYGAILFDCIDYTSTSKNKTSKGFSGASMNLPLVDALELDSSVWLNTSAITSISFSISLGNYTTGTTFALYGIK